MMRIQQAANVWLPKETKQMAWDLAKKIKPCEVAVC